MIPMTRAVHSTLESRRRRLSRWSLAILAIGLVVSSALLALSGSSEAVSQSAVSQGVQFTSYALGDTTGVVCVDDRSTFPSSRLLSQRVLRGIQVRDGLRLIPLTECRLAIREAVDSAPPTRLRELGTGLPAAVVWVERTSLSRVRIGVEGGEFIGAVYACRAVPVVAWWVLVGCAPTTIS